MGKMIRQTMFSTGEVDEITWKRTDVNEYLTAAQSLLNCEVGTTGLAKKRKGTEVMLNATPYASFNSRMYEFVDKNDNHYLVMSADHVFYIFNAPTDQVNVITARDNYVITGRGNYVVANESNFTFVQSVASPYSQADLDAIDYTQDDDALIITHPNFPPARIYISSYSPSPVFSYQALDIYPLPAYDFNTFNYNAYDVISLSAVGDQLTMVVDNPAGASLFTTAWIGGQIVGGGATEIDPIGYAIITNVVTVGGQTTFTGLIQIAFNTSTFASQLSQYSIKQPAWSATLGYPAKVVFYQNRLWLGNTKTLNNTIFGSKINSPINYDVGTGRDTDAIIYKIGQSNSGAIQWMNGGKQLEIFCDNFEFACPQDQNSALTPSTFSIRQQTSYGSSRLLKPQNYINDSYFVSKSGKAMLNYHFNGVGLAYSSSNISAASSHLVKNPRNRALLRGSDTSQDNFIYFLNPDDDTLTAFQFAAEYKLAALTPVTFQQDIEGENIVQLVDIVTIDNEVYILKYYTLSNTFTVERFNSNVKIDGSRTADMDATGLVTGLETLEGYTVQVVYQNQDFGQYLVEDGEITVNNPEGIADTVFVGLLYDVEITPMYLFAGSAAAPFFKQMSRIYVDYFESLDFYINGTLVPYQNFADIQAGLPLQPQTGTAIISPVSGYDRFATFSVTQSSPFDLQILSIGYQLDMAVI